MSINDVIEKSWGGALLYQLHGITYVADNLRVDTTAEVVYGVDIYPSSNRAYRPMVISSDIADLVTFVESVDSLDDAKIKFPEYFI